ncbi:MAG: 1-acyl-sn-glycerol-3-phosphate acyltransferase [Candidatus Hydrogenedentota bacterium]
MKTIASWYVTIRFVLSYLFYKLGIGSVLDPNPRFDSFQFVIGQFTHWNRYIRVRGAENVAADHPAIYCGNHIKFGDPFYVFHGVYLSTDKSVKLHAMSRNDFFEGTPLKTRFFDADEFIVTVGVHGISRDAVTLAQMKVFINMLIEGESFIMFPGRTRSRSGLLMEYRDNFVEPGSVSFFLNTAQRRKKGTTFSAIPVSRNYNPARDHTCMIYGPEQFLTSGASREEQREYDFHLIETIGNLVEVCVPQVVSALLYSHCLHQISKTITVPTLKKQTRAIREKSRHPYWDEEDDADLDAAVDLAIKYLARKKVLKRSGDDLHLNAAGILLAPDPESKYSEVNPVKYLTNQLLHLGDLIELIQDQVPRNS